MFEAAELSLLTELISRETWAGFENEITEEEWHHDLLEAERKRQISGLTDAEAITELIDVEATLAAAHARRAQLVALVAEHRPASGDRPSGQPGGAGHVPAEDQVPEVLPVSEWLSHELQMAHPYSRPAALDLVETSLVLSGRLSATLDLLQVGRIDYPRARVLADLLATCTEPVAHTVQALVLPKAPGLTPGGVASAVRRALAKVDAAAIRARHAKARRSADVRYWPTEDGMARLSADLPLPVAAACAEAISRYAQTQHAEGDHRPIGQIRTEVLTDLILRPWDSTRPSVTAEITLHLTLPTTSPGTRTDTDTEAAAHAEADAEAEVDGQIITAAQCRELLAQLHASRLFLALHDHAGGLQAVATPSELSRAAHRRGRGHPTGETGIDDPGLRPPKMTTRKTPTRAQDRHVRTRDRTCRHFGCTRTASHADLDHHQPWPQGQTSVGNLTSYCRTHHRLKHQAPGWTRDLHPDATLTITTPTGNTRSSRPPGTTDPPGPVDWPKPAAQQPDSTRVPPSPTATPTPTSDAEPGQPEAATTAQDDPPPF